MLVSDVGLLVWVGLLDSVVPDDEDDVVAADELDGADSLVDAEEEDGASEAELVGVSTTEDVGTVEVVVSVSSAKAAGAAANVIRALAATTAARRPKGLRKMCSKE
ncbi:hypothetical protein [Amycolatopsis sacchari]|uniref:hypothetical protein n=1 Tax=Amycolatopsis sacchari TaxID=115433 RepID=UPI003D70819F